MYGFLILPSARRAETERRRGGCSSLVLGMSVGAEIEGGPVEGRLVPLDLAVEASKLRPPKSLRSGGSLMTTGAAAAGAAAGAGEAFCMNFIFSKVSLMPPEGDAAGAALGARGVACFLLFWKRHPCCLSCVFYPCLRRARTAAAEQCTSPKPSWRHARVAAVFAQLHCCCHACQAPVVLLLGRCGRVCGRTFRSLALRSHTS